jgi:hypothetical protein
MAIYAMIKIRTYQEPQVIENRAQGEHFFYMKQAIYICKPHFRLA